MSSLPSPLLAVQLFSQFPKAVREKIAASRERLQQLTTQIAGYDPQLVKQAAVTGSHKAERVKLASLILQRELEKRALGGALLRGLGSLAAKGVTKGIPAVARGAAQGAQAAGKTVFNAAKATAPHLAQAGRSVGSAVSNAASAGVKPAGGIGKQLQNAAVAAAPGAAGAVKSVGRAAVAHPLNTAATTTAALHYGDKAVNETQGLLERRRVAATQQKQVAFEQAKKQQMAKLHKYLADSEAKAREAEQLLQGRDRISSFVAPAAGNTAAAAVVPAAGKKKKEVSPAGDKTLQNSRVTAAGAGSFLR